MLNRYAPSTTDSPLLAWLADPCAHRGVRVADELGGYEYIDYQRLARSVRGAAREIAAARRQRGGVAAIVMTNGPEFIVAWFAVLLAGDIPCPLAPPGMLQEPAEYERHLQRVLHTAAPTSIITTAGLLEQVAAISLTVSTAPVPIALSFSDSEERLVSVPRSSLALLQFTSGSSGNPRAARVTWENLERNVEMIVRWFDGRQDDVVASWLPMYHDMGLIGLMLVPVTRQLSLVLMRPDQFIRDPFMWLDCFASHGATASAAPNFGFAYAARRIDPARLAGSDLSGWRVVACAAERIDTGALSAFVELTAPHGFRPEALLPCYGLAEATLAVCCGGVDEPVQAVRVDWNNLGFGAPVRVLERSTLVADNAGWPRDSVGWLVACGRSRTGSHFWIADEQGEPLPEGRLGEIIVDSACVVDGYHGGESTGSSQIDGSVLRTGDAGFLLDGELYVIGRIGDSTKVRGRSLYMEDVENRLAVLDGIKTGRCVALTGVGPSGQEVVAVVEADQAAFDQAAELLARAASWQLPARVFRASRGTIKRTSSGKPRRRVMWRELVEGRLAAELVAERPLVEGSRP